MIVTSRPFRRSHPLGYRSAKMRISRASGPTRYRQFRIALRRRPTRCDKKDPVLDHGLSGRTKRYRDRRAGLDKTAGNRGRRHGLQCASPDETTFPVRRTPSARRQGSPSALGSLPRWHQQCLCLSRFVSLKRCRLPKKWKRWPAQITSQRLIHPQRPPRQFCRPAKVCSHAVRGRPARPCRGLDVGAVGHVRQCVVGWVACGHDHAVFVEMLGMGSVSS